MSKIGRDEDYPGGNIRRLIDRAAQTIAPGGRNNPVIKKCHWIEHNYRALHCLRRLDFETAIAEFERAKQNSRH